MIREEAIKILRDVHDKALFPVRNALETLIPELAESEDERVRKELYAVINDLILPDDQKARFNGWLEKQKEQIPYTDFVIKPHKGDDNNPYDMQVSEALEYAINRGFDIPVNDGEVYVDERHITQTIGNILRWADEHPKEQKPTGWSEGDENCLKYAIDGLERYIKEHPDPEFGNATPCEKTAIRWLKSLRNRPKVSDNSLEKEIDKE